MKVIACAEVESFLARTREALESNEAANSLMLGICERLARQPERVDATTRLWTVEDDEGLVLAALMTPPRSPVVYGHGGDLAGGARALVEELEDEGFAYRPASEDTFDKAAAYAKVTAPPPPDPRPPRIDPELVWKPPGVRKWPILAGAGGGVFALLALFVALKRRRGRTGNRDAGAR